MYTFITLTRIITSTNPTPQTAADGSPVFETTVFNVNPNRISAWEPLGQRANEGGSRVYIVGLGPIEVEQCSSDVGMRVRDSWRA